MRWLSGVCRWRVQICWGMKDSDTILRTVWKRLLGNGGPWAGWDAREWGRFPKAVAAGGPASPGWQVLVQFGKGWVEGSQPAHRDYSLHLLC